jgi:hypothetical protein
MKLTRAQWFTLVDASEGGFRSHRTYKPAIRLVELGLCKWRATKGLERNVLDITDDGDLALAELPAPIAKVIAENEEYSQQAPVDMEDNDDKNV